MKMYGYAEEVQVKYSNKGWGEVRLIRLTHAGLYLLTNTPDVPTEEERLKNAYQPQKRKLKRNSYMSSDQGLAIQRDILYNLAAASDSSPENYAQFQSLFLEAFSDGQLTPLASEPVLAKSVSMTPKIKSAQIYAAWKLMNIEALFRANGFMTSIDRRPKGIGRTVKPPQEIVESGDRLDICDYAAWVLSQWYKHHPESYSFRNPAMGFEEWKSTPAFYPLKDLPGFESVIDEDLEMNPGGAKTIMRHSSLGVAVGMRCNYLVYHAKQKGISWAINVERNTAKAVQRVLDITAENTPIMGANRTIQNAIIVCPTVHQFASLFDVEEGIPNRWKKYTRIDAPFKSASIVPINHSGLMQLRVLMFSNPIAFEQTVISNFKKLPGFTDRPAGNNEKDNIFKLSYNGKPVLLAQLMELQKLYWAKQQYEEGKRFYVVCYPEQVKFIQKIMPEVAFL